MTVSTEQNRPAQLPPGVQWTGTLPTAPPDVTVKAKPKSGKSTLARTLKGWHWQPNGGTEPLVFAFDQNGPSASASLGYPLAVINVIALEQDPFFAERFKSGMPVELKGGMSVLFKARAALSYLKELKRSGALYQHFNSIVVDCGSTMTSTLYNYAQSIKAADKRNGGVAKDRDKRQIYGDLADWARSIHVDLKELGLPLVWLGWLAEPFKDENDKLVLGRMLLEGQKTREIIEGNADQNMYLEKRWPVGDERQYADTDGFLRILHTRTYDNIDNAGRFQERLPAQMQANLAYVFDCILGRAQ